MPMGLVTAFRAVRTAGASRFGFALLGGANHSVKPFADRHSGAARGVTRSRAGFRTETSEIPWTARFHSRAQIDAGRIGCAPLASRSSRNSNAEVTPYCSETGLFRITVNNPLRKCGTVISRSRAMAFSSGISARNPVNFAVTSCPGPRGRKPNRWRRLPGYETRRRANEATRSQTRRREIPALKKIWPSASRRQLREGYGA